MRHSATATVAAISALGLLPIAAVASTAHHREKAPPAKCVRNSHTLFASSQAEVYSAPEDEVLSIRACASGQRHTFFVAGCNREEPARACAARAHVTLAGSVVAYEEGFIAEGQPSEPSISELRVGVRDLRNGRLLHDVPTGAPLIAEPRYVGVGPVVALVLESDGSVAWIAEDDERTKSDGIGSSYFDVYAADKTGTRLVASGVDIDPSSLAISVGATNVGAPSRSIVGNTLYWTEAGKAVSALLD